MEYEYIILKREFYGRMHVLLSLVYLYYTLSVMITEMSYTAIEIYLKLLDELTLHFALCLHVTLLLDFLSIISSVI